MVSNVAAMRLHVPEALRAHQELIRYGRACGLLPSVPDDMSDEDMVAVLSAFQCNNFGIADELWTVQGAGIYPVGALLNHSCEPNCVITYEPITHTQVIRAIRSIRAGEELTHAYLDPVLPRPQRLSQLQQTYGFECRCSRCAVPCDAHPVDRRLERELPLAADQTDEARTRALQLASSMLERAAMLEGGATGDDGDAVVQEGRLIQKALQIREQHLDPIHYQVLQATSTAFTNALLRGDMTTATAHCKRIIAIYREVYFQNHPMLGLQLYTLADIERQTDRHSAVLHFEEALKIYRVTQGAEHATCRDIESILRDLQFS